MDHNTIKKLVAAAERNIADYSGDMVPESIVKDCIAQAEELLKQFNTWLLSEL